MMPRRRRKTSGHRPRLEFVESPVNIIHGLPSPVFPADHPPTAEVVPVNEQSHTWVSPQFRGLPDDQKRKRKRGKNKNVLVDQDPGTRHSIHSTVNTTHRFTELKHIAKYKPLNFMADENLEQSGTLSNQETAPGGRDMRVPASGANAEQSMRLSAVDNGTGLDSLLDTAKIISRQLHVCRAEGLNIEAGNQHTEAIPSLENTAICPSSNKRNKRPARTLFSNPGTPTESNCQPRRGSRRKVSNSGPCDDTSSSTTHMAPQPDEQLHQQNDTIPFLNNVTPNTPSNIDTSNGYSEMPRTSHVRALSDVTTPVNRRITRMRSKQCVFESPERSGDLGPILAYDTPEEDYSLTIAQRMRKYSNRTHRRTRLRMN